MPVCLLEQDDLYTLAWSFDPYRMRPVIAVGGESGLVYIVDVEARTMHRILSGHGDVSRCSLERTLTIR